MDHNLRIDAIENADDIASLALPICEAIFPAFQSEYLLGRLPHIAGRQLLVAMDQDRPLAFKLGYRRGERLFYSWLGGVLPEARRQGLAALLMERQHGDAAAAGYSAIETRTRAINTAMIILNLRHGFQVCGYETDPGGIGIVTQRKQLAAA